MLIDESKKYVLTNYKPAKHGKSAVDSDHYTIYMDVAIEVRKDEFKRVEIFDFKESENFF